jgi:hypothetical protein
MECGLDHAYIHNPTIDVPKLLETKESGAMGGVIEDERLDASEMACHTTDFNTFRLTVVA